MKINELIEMYNNNPRIDIAKQIDTKQYVGIEQKKMLAELVLDNCVSIVDDEVHIDSVDRYILFTIAVISLHTNLEFSYGEEDGSVIEDYDLLCESGLLVKIIDTFKDDYTSCQEILNMMTSDILQESMTIEKKIYNFIDTMQDVLAGAIDSLTEKFGADFINELQLDKNKLDGLFNLLSEYNKN